MSSAPPRESPGHSDKGGAGGGSAKTLDEIGAEMGAGRERSDTDTTFFEKLREALTGHNRPREKRPSFSGLLEAQPDLDGRTSYRADGTKYRHGEEAPVDAKGKSPREPWFRKFLKIVRKFEQNGKRDDDDEGEEEEEDGLTDRDEDDSEDEEVTPKQSSRLRKKRANAKVRRRKKTFRGQVLSEMMLQKEAQEAMAQFETHVKQLKDFYAQVDPNRPHIDDHCRGLLNRYPIGNIALALMNKYNDLPQGWEKYYETAKSAAEARMSVREPPGYNQS